MKHKSQPHEIIPESEKEIFKQEKVDYRKLDNEISTKIKTIINRSIKRDV